jgi:hypothetical protein
MNYTIGDGIAAIALAGGIVGWHFVTHRSRLKRLQIIHEERMAAMEKGIPLPEFPFEPDRREADPDNVIPILGTVLSCLSAGAMIVLYVNLDSAARGMWVAPLPFVFLGVGLIAYHFLQRGSGR